MATNGSRAISQEPTVPEQNEALRTARTRISSPRAIGEGMSRAELAEAANQWLDQHTSTAGAMDERYIGKLERGVVRWPGRNYRAALRAVLGARSDADLGLRPARRASDDTSPPAIPLGTTGDDIRPWELIDSLTRGTVSETTLGHAERLALQYAQRYPSTPPPELLPDVSRLIKRMNDVLNYPQPIRVRQRAVAILGLLSGISGNLWLDLGNPTQATNFFDAAELAAREATDSDLTVWVLSTRSVTAYFEQNYNTASALLDQAEALTQRSSKRRHAWVAALQARAAAALERNDDAEMALDRAYQHLADVDDPPAGTDFFDRARLDAIAGTVHLRLSDTERAFPLLSRAVDQRQLSDAKGRALASLDIAHCRTIDDEPEEAARIASHALATARGSIVQPILIKAHDVQGRMQPWWDVRAVQEFSNQLLALSYG